MKQLLSSYSISGNVVTLTGVNRPREAVLSITNSTTGAILYTAQTGGATSYTQDTNSTITLATAPGTSDRLQIFYDDGVAPANAPTSVSVSNLPATQPVSAASLPLPTGAATESGNLATIATEAVAIDNKLPSLSSGRVPVEANNAASEVYNYTASGNVSSNTVLMSFECARFREIIIHGISFGAGCTVAVEISNNNIDWVGAPYQNVTSGSAATTSFSSTNNIYSVLLHSARFFRLRQANAQTSGTTTLVAYASQQATPKLYQSVTGSVSVTGQVSTTSLPSPATMLTNSVGFATFHSLVSAATTNATSVKASAGMIGTCVLTNTSASWRFVKIFNSASAPSVGTSTPVIQFPIAPNSSLDVSSSFAGLRLTSGIAYAITGGSALLDNTAVSAGEVLVNICYQ